MSLSKSEYASIQVIYRPIGGRHEAERLPDDSVVATWNAI
jgi:hypothetical protein